MLLKLLMVITGLTLFVFTYWALRTVRKNRLQTLQRLEVYGDADNEQKMAEKQASGSRVSMRDFLSKVGLRLAGVTPKKILEALHEDLVKAGIPLRADELVSLSLGLSLIVAFCLFILTGATTYTLMGLVVGSVLPILMVRRRVAKRLKALEAQLGDVLMFIANALKAGHSFMSALQLAAKETRPPFSQEITKVLREVNLGVPTEEALLNMAARAPSEDLDLMVTVVLIQRKIGGNLAEILDNISGTIRDRIRLKKEIKTLTAQSRVSGIIIGLIPLIMGGLLFVINPAYMLPLFTHPLGLMMLGAAGVAEIIGILFIKRIINIEV